MPIAAPPLSREGTLAHRRIAQCLLQSRVRSSRESALASPSANNAVTFEPAFSPKCPGNVNHWLASSPKLVDPASTIAGTNPAADWSLVSSKSADKALDLWKPFAYDLLFVSVEISLNRFCFS